MGGGRTGSIFERTPGSRYLIKEGRETPQEIEASKTTPGSGQVAARNNEGGVYAWLIYDFAVGDHKLKPGHVRYLNGILDDIIGYGRTYRRTGVVRVNGYASPSGEHSQNLKLAENRAKAVVNHLVRSGGSKMDRSWFFVSNTVKPSDIYAVVKGIPRTPTQRALCRGVYVVLWLARTVTKPDPFPEDKRRRALGQVDRFQKYDKRFYTWVIQNWAYLMNPSNRYARAAFPPEDGLFFKPPSNPLQNDRAVWTYLKNLRQAQKDAADRLKNQYTGVPGSSALPAGGKPVLSYQQLARWIALDGHTRGRGKDVVLFDFMPGVAIQKSFNELIDMINAGKFGKKEEVYERIEKYFKKHGIPIKVVRTPHRG